MSHLSPKVHKQLTRLKGRIPAGFAPGEQIVDTPVGPRPVPPSVQALLAVEWPAKHVLLTKDEFGWEVHIPAECETEKGLVREDRAWYTVGYDEGQWYIVVDLDEAAASGDPLTYRVDHEGDEPVPWAETLSERLAGIKVKRPPAAKYAFIRSCAVGDIEAVRAGLAAGASLGPVNDTGITPLHMAVFTGRSVELVELLVEAGADVNAAVVREIPSLHTFVEKERLFGREYRVGDTPLTGALDGFDWRAHDAAPIAAELVRILLEAGADPNVSDKYGNRPLPQMASARSPELVEVVRMLLAFGAEVGTEGGGGRTPLDSAVFGSPEIIAELLDRGADPGRRGSGTNLGIKGLTPLHVAAFGAEEANLRLLVDAAGDVDVRSLDGFTPLHLAAMAVNPVKARMLLDAGADPRIPVPGDPGVLRAGLRARTPLEIARELERDEVAAVLEEFLARP
ncbi:ankyrin repeat domain-containing protein [Phytomonospora endophytica]|uniref:Ankyrin repeat protein n=1 Tax=Phytomonospora endophytica TaxID=714109 RepID=A0A841FZ57_9ACTN|nr:ankyrin repeat domain-containing protein [Phytomonospora endophytica]MBB6037230.1 ankyrin repeat protein [Phytomonospora endophytica]GIG71268.1 hypothetical protein Pen01_75630 [Phytomonospora endophytica]